MEKCGAMKASLATIAGVLLTLGTIAAAAPVAGTFALQSGTPKAQAFLRASDAGSPLAQRLDIWMTRLDGTAPIVDYDVDMTKLLHLIVVSDDFKQFFHIHPVLGSDGHFTIDQTFPTPALYHAYADGEPRGLGQQVFRFDVPVAGGTAAATRSLAPTGPRVSAGPYAVVLSATTLESGKETKLDVHILRDGKPARDLHPYLGALAHAVFLDAKDLTYVHVHPAPPGSDSSNSMSGMDMPGMEMPALPDSAAVSPDMTLHVTVREAGTYKLWLQFSGGGNLYVAPFVLTAT